jgi:hypothetical protein
MTPEGVSNWSPSKGKAMEMTLIFPFSVEQTEFDAHDFGGQIGKEENV